LAKRKLKHFEDNSNFPHFFQPRLEELRAGFKLKGKWNQDVFRNNNPIILEIGCGKGEYTVGLAARNPGRNYIGIDIKGARMWNGASKSFNDNMNNVAFLRTRVEFIPGAFDRSEVDEIWITFPDPQPRNSRERKRLTSQKYLDIYSHLISPNGIIHLKTDNSDLFDYTLEVIKENNHSLIYSTKDLYSETNIDEAQGIQTFYENMFLAQGFKICYLKFVLHGQD